MTDSKHHSTLVQCFSNFLFEDPFWLRKITTDPHSPAHVNIECPDDMYPKSYIYISELIIDGYEYVEACVTMHCVI